MRALSVCSFVLALVAGTVCAQAPITEDDFAQLLEDLEDQRVLEQKQEEIDQIRARRRVLAGETEGSTGGGGLRLIRLMGSKDRGVAEFSQGDLVFRLRVGERLGDGSQLVGLRAGGAELKSPNGTTRLVMLGAAASESGTGGVPTLPVRHALPATLRPTPPATVPAAPLTAAGGGAPQ